MGRLTCKDCIHHDVCLIVEISSSEEDHYTQFGCKDMLTADTLVEQKQGHWIYKHDEEGNTGNAQYECSECGAGDLHAKSQDVPYCWKCGAKMDEVEE